MTPATGGTPLFALEAVALDLETTGLDPANARVVELAAVPVSGGTVACDLGFGRLVDPGSPIPPASTRIHGITDAMVRGAPHLPELWSQFAACLDERVVIGHTIAFDLTVLAAEAKRNGLPWRRPRALCVRMLATIAMPSLASHSLDALVNWLGLESRDRHRASGDAEAAGRVFLALVPRLEVLGIRTLAEAERACCGLTGDLDRQARAGWEPPVTDPGTTVLAAVDSYPYRHRVADVMSSPPLVVAPETTLRQAVDVMVARTISSVFVASPASPGQPAQRYAIFTERDAMRRIAERGAAALDEPVGAIGSQPVVTIRENAFLYRAIGRMSRIGSRHLGVRSDAGNLVGAVSARDLLKLHASPAIALDDTIEEARSAKDLAVAWATLPAVVRSLVAEEIDAPLICQVISEEIRAMTRRAAVLAEQAMSAGGRGGPPCGYAILVLGSGGRGESLLVPDQDNALVFEAGDPGGAEDRWFADLAAHMADILDAAGIPYCKGGVMASNEAWRGSSAGWRDRIERWVRLARPRDLLNVDIFFDQMPVHGTLALGMALQQAAFAAGRSSATFAKLLGDRLTGRASPLTLFGGLRGRDGRVDLKMHILFPVASAARALAIRHGVVERSTRARIEELIARGIGSETELAGLLDAHALGLSLLLERQSRDVATGVRPSSEIRLDSLTRRQHRELKSAVVRVQALPTLLRDLMFTAGAE